MKCARDKQKLCDAAVVHCLIIARRHIWFVATFVIVPQPRKSCGLSLLRLAAPFPFLIKFAISAHIWMQAAYKWHNRNSPSAECCCEESGCTQVRRRVCMQWRQPPRDRDNYIEHYVYAGLIWMQKLRREWGFNCKLKMRKGKRRRRALIFMALLGFRAELDYIYVHMPRLHTFMGSKISLWIFK